MKIQIKKRWDFHSLCECCKTNLGVQIHHKCPQRKWLKKLYGQLIHNEKNLMRVCYNCHIGNPHPKLIHWNEKQFCEALKIEMRSKTKC